MPARVLIAGISTRAAADSAARAGFDVTAIDAFGDLDQHPSVRGLSLPRDFGLRFTARAAARASRNVECDAVAYLSSLENHPGAVAALAAGRALWGNAPDVLRRVRDPRALASALRRRGVTVAELGGPDDASSRSLPNPRSSRNPPTEWLVKPLKSGGGQGIRRWVRGDGVPRGCYVQEFIDGTPASIVFVAASGRAIPLGVSRQFMGESVFGASGFRYCGNMLVSTGDAQLGDEVVGRACELAGHVADEFHLVGVNGIDFIVCEGVPCALEVNPRWSSSMELVERAYGVSVFGAHAAACASGGLPPFDVTEARRRGRASGKAVVFARTDLIAGDTQSWLGDSSVRDVPPPGERISAGDPVCTVFAEGVDGASCHTALVRRAERLYEEIAAWST